MSMHDICHGHALHMSPDYHAITICMRKTKHCESILETFKHIPLTLMCPDILSLKSYL